MVLLVDGSTRLMAAGRVSGGACQRLSHSTTARLYTFIDLSNIIIGNAIAGVSELF
jgi:hypothetical protein